MLLKTQDNDLEYPGMLGTRTFEIKWISRNKPSGLDFQSKPDAIVLYDGNIQTVEMKER